MIFAIITHSILSIYLLKVQLKVSLPLLIIAGLARACRRFYSLSDTLRLLLLLPTSLASFVQPHGDFVDTVSPIGEIPQAHAL